MDGGSVATMPALEAPALVREVKLFQSLLQQRDRWYEQVLSEAHVLADEAAEAEAELVHALDRADFAEAQLDSLLRRAPQSKSMAMLAPEHWKLAKNAETQLIRHLELANEVSERKERVAWAVARLRVLQALCTWAESTSQSEGDGALATVLRRCEDDLLQACSTDMVTARLATELQYVSPLNLVLPSLLGEPRPDEYRVNSKDSVPIAERGTSGQEQWLLPLKSPSAVANHAIAGDTVPAVTGGQEEDCQRLKREIEELTDRNETLRSQMRTEPLRRSAPRLPQFALVEGDAHQGVEEVAACKASQQRLVHELRQLTSGQGGQQLPHPVPQRSVKEQAGRAVRLQQMVQLRAALADAYEQLAVCAPPGGQVAGLPLASDSENPALLIVSLERRLEEARAENAVLRSAGNAEARAHQETDIIQRMARNTSEIKSLKEKLRRSEMQEVRRREIARHGGGSVSVPSADAVVVAATPSRTSPTPRSRSNLAGAVSVSVAMPAQIAPTPQQSFRTRPNLLAESSLERHHSESAAAMSGTIGISALPS